MKILKSIYTGFKTAAGSWKGVLITWLFSVILVSVFAVPFKGAVNSAIGSSMITEQLLDGFNPAVFSEMGSQLKVIISFFSTGLLFLLFTGFFINTFFAGGLFSGVRKSTTNRSFQEFFRTSARNFGSFLVISVVIRLIINFITGIILAVPIVILTTSDNLSTKTTIIIALAAGLMMIIAVPVLLLVADNARSWQASNEKFASFSAIGFGFGETFRRFWSSYPMMLLILVIQAVYLVVVFGIISGWNTATGSGVFYLFILTQIFVFGKILLKTWRYGSVTALMEINSIKDSKNEESEGNFL